MRVGIGAVAYEHYGVSEGARKAREHGYDCYDFGKFVSSGTEFFLQTEANFKAELLKYKSAVEAEGISVSNRGRGLSGKIIEFAADFAVKNGKKSLRIDTHRGNAVMRRMLEKNGFVYCGIIYLEGGEERVAYEKMI